MAVQSCRGLRRLSLLPLRGPLRLVQGPQRDVPERAVELLERGAELAVAALVLHALELLPLGLVVLLDVEDGAPSAELGDAALVLLVEEPGEGGGVLLAHRETLRTLRSWCRLVDVRL